MQMFRNASISVCPAVSGKEVLYLWIHVRCQGKILQPMRVFRPSNVRCSVAIRTILGWLHFRRPCCFPLLICYEATSIWILSHSISTFWGLGVALSGFMWFPWTRIIADWSWPRGCDPMLCRLRFVPWGHQSATWRDDCVVSPNIFDYFEYLDVRWCKMERYFYGITVGYFLDDSICVLLFPTLTCGVFVFSAVSAPSPPPPPACPQILTHTHLPHTYITQSHTASLAHTNNHSLTHSLTHALTHSLTITHTHTHHSHYTYITHPNYTHHTLITHSSLTPLLLHSTPLHSHITHTHTSQTQSLAHTSLTSLCRWLLRGRCGAWCSASGRMASQVRAGGFCMPHHLVLCKGSDVRPGAPCSPPLCRWLLRGRCGIVRHLVSSASGRMAWQVRHLVLCKRSDVRPGVPWCSAKATGRATETKGRQGVHLSPCRTTQKPPAERRRPAKAYRCGRLQCSARGRMYAPGVTQKSPPSSAGDFCVTPGAALGALQAVGCTPWQVRHLVLCKRCRGCTPWQVRRLVLCKRSDVRPGVPWSPHHNLTSHATR